MRRWPNPHITLAKACKRAGIPHCSAHDFRRTFTSRLKHQGVDSLLVGWLLGHTTGAMVEKVYARRDVEALRGAMELI